MPDATLVPHNLDAERSVLGAILLDSESIHSIISSLQPDDFFDPIYRVIYAAIYEMYVESQPIDFVTVASKLSGNEAIDRIGGSAFLAELAVDVPTSSHIEQYAEILRCRSTRRQMLKLGKEIGALATTEDRTTTELIETVEKRLLELQYASTQEKPAAVGELCAERYDHYIAVHDSDTPEDYFGIQTGFADLDRLIVGLRSGDMVVLGGRPSMGKTAVALEIARRVATEQCKNVGFFSLEMNKEQLFDRLFASYAQVEEYKLSRGELSEDKLSALGGTFDQIGEIPIFLDDDADKSITNLRSKARRFKMERGIDLLIIDYLQLIQVPGHVSKDNRTEQLRYISENVKALAREIDAPIIALSQLNREADKRIDKRPQLSDLRESGAIEQDADFVLLLYREAYYDEDCDAPEITDLYLKKNRPHGETGHVELRFDKTRSRFFGVSNRTEDE